MKLRSHIRQRVNQTSLQILVNIAISLYKNLISRQIRQHTRCAEAISGYYCGAAFVIDAVDDFVDKEFVGSPPMLV